MSVNLLNILSNEFTGDVINKLAPMLGQDKGTTQAAIGYALPALVGGLADKASTREGASELLDLLKRNNFDSERYTSPAAALSKPDGISGLMEMGRPLLNNVLGGRTNSIIDWLSAKAGVGRNPASSLLSFALPVVLGVIGRQVAKSGWNVSNLMSLLGDQRSYLPSDLPGIESIPRVEREPEVTRRAAAATAFASEPVRHGSNWWKWALPLLALLAIPALFYFLSRREEPRPVATTQPTPGVRTESVAPAPQPVVVARPELGAFIDKRLPDGTTIRIPSNGVENKLIGYIEDSNQQVNKETWFSFDRIEFDTDSAKLRPASEEQLRNIAEIMEAYPNTAMKIGGYTDNVGDNAHNRKLSQERANSTMNEIARLGVDRSRLTAEGYGEEHPVADNSTEEGRQRNRRIDIRLTKK